MLSGVRHGFGGNGEYDPFSVNTEFAFSRLKKSKLIIVRVVLNLKTFDTRKSSWLGRSPYRVPACTIWNVRNAPQPLGRPRGPESNAVHFAVAKYPSKLW